MKKKKILWSDEPQFFIHVWGKPSIAYHLHNTIPTMKHGGDSIVQWGVFQQQGLGKWSEKTESWMQLNTEISFVKTWFRVLRTSDWAESAPANMTIPLCSTHTAKTMQEWLRDDSMNVLEWPCRAETWNQSDIFGETL